MNCTFGKKDFERLAPPVRRGCVTQQHAFLTMLLPKLRERTSVDQVSAPLSRRRPIGIPISPTGTIFSSTSVGHSPTALGLQRGELSKYLNCKRILTCAFLADSALWAAS